MRHGGGLNRFTPCLKRNRQANSVRTEAGLYLITDGSVRNGGTGLSLLRKVEEALKGGVRLVQLREKQLGGNELFPLALLAQKMRKLTSAYKAGLIINNNAQVAVECGADGIHLPQSGLSVSAARQALGTDALIGVSTHSVKEAAEAEDDGADFVTFGPVYYTESKAEYGEPVGLTNLKEAVESINIPLFGLGGIGAAEIEEVLGAGAYGIGLISAILHGTDIQSAAEEAIAGLYRNRPARQ